MIHHRTCTLSVSAALKPDSVTNEVMHGIVVPRSLIMSLCTQVPLPEELD